MISLVKIDKAKHIVIVTNSETFANSSALYTYILTLHKKVSIVNEGSKLEHNLSCIPWFDKVKVSISSSSDLIIDMKEENEPLFNWFKSNNIKINKKMATSLYASILKSSEYFVGNHIDGIIFASISELITIGADYKLCNKFILKSLPLSLFRLKAIMYKSLVLKDSATKAVLYINSKSLKVSGASLEDAYKIMREVLKIAHVESVILLDMDYNNKQIKIIKGNNS